jgi:putative oxidoreductase
MQRIYSTFPSGWPGAGLLLLRLASGVAAVVDAGSSLWECSGAPMPMLRILEMLGGFLFLCGLTTPIAGLMLAAIEIAFLLLGRTSVDRNVAILIVALSLAMLGPGAYSVDARLFGRKRIDLNSLDD